MEASSDLKHLTRRWFEEVWNEKRTDTIYELFSPEGKGYGLGPSGYIEGPKMFEQFHQRFLSAFSDINIDIGDVIAEGDKTAVRFTCSATHDGPGLDMPASGNQVSFSGMTWVTWRDGKIVEGWNNYDQFEIMRQIGALPGV
jgi:steroid delta-isomerase-like uncharacterized protein